MLVSRFRARAENTGLELQWSEPRCMDLKHHFLIAMPNMVDPNFSGSVVYVCEHNDKTALGLVINRPTELTLARLFDKIDLKLEIAPWKDELV